MALFQFLAKDLQGNTRQGVLETTNASEAFLQLRSRGWITLKVEETRQKTLKTPFFQSLVPWGGRVRSLDIEIGLRQLAAMLHSGIELSVALDYLIQHTSRPRLIRLWSQIAQDIQQGMSFSEALQRQKKISPVVAPLVLVGEQTGTLEENLKRATLIMEQRRKIRTNIAQALAYPLFVFCLAVVAAVFLVAKILPKIQVFLATLGRDIPPITRQLVNFSEWLVQVGPMAMAILAFSCFAFIFFYTSAYGRYTVDRFLLRLPFIGILLQLSGSALLSRCMSTTLRSGLTVVDSLQMVSQLYQNRYFVHELEVARESVLQGSSLATPLTNSNAFVPILPQFVATGEASGSLDTCFEGVAELCEYQFETSLRWFGTIFTPLLIIAIGLFIGFIYVSFFVAILGSVSFSR
jgi:type IV pilus assembly protein PilC